MKYVQHDRGKWKVRITVPEELRVVIGKRELVESDLPSDAKSREKLAHGIINRFFAQIDEAREALKARQKSPSVMLSAAAKSHYAATVASDQQRRAAMPTAEEIDAERERALAALAEEQRTTGHRMTSLINATTQFELVAGARHFDQKNRTRRLAALRSSFASGETRWIEATTDQYILDNRLEINRGLKGWRELADALTRAEIEALERTIEQDKGDFSGQPSDPLLTAPDQGMKLSNGSHPSNAHGLLLSDALAGFHRERMVGQTTLAKKTMEEHRNAVRMFAEFWGSDMAISLITKKDVIRYKEALLQTPNRYTMRFPGLTLPQAIKANAKLTQPYSALAPKTVNMKWLSHLSSVLNWAADNAHIDFNPAKGVRVDTGSKVHQESSRLAFTKADLKMIFGSPMFADTSTYGLKQWALLVMLFTGVRNSSEMARMTLDNIYYEQGIPVFDLAEATKNQQSKRLVPIHSDLVKVGFLDYVAQRRAAGELLLFPEWAARPDKVNDWFNDIYLVSLGLKNPKKVFYCFRHTLATELARAGVPRELSKMISGHAPQEVASIYIQASPITLMSYALNKVKFDIPVPGLPGMGPGIHEGAQSF